MRIKRLHDAFYLKEKRYKNPKQSFKLLVNLLKKRVKLNKNHKVLDVGCANGELIYFLSKNFKCQITGLDNHKELINLCKKKFSNKFNFILKDISKKQNFKDKFDVIIVSGVISIFDNLDTVFKNLKKLLNKNGKIYIFNHLNPFPIEVFIKYQTNDKNRNILQSGWNIHSISKIKNIFKKLSLRKFSIYKFEPKPFKGKKNDLLRSWTFKLSNKKNLITNGLSIIQKQFWLEISY